MNITINNTTKKEKAILIVESLNKKLGNKSFMDFYFSYCPIGGSFDIMLNTKNKDVTKEELKDMYIYVVTDFII